MDIQNKSIPTLELFLRPAFCAVDGKITQINSLAAPYCLCVGDEVAPLLFTGVEEFYDFREGYLYLTLCIGGQKVDATVISSNGTHLFLLEQQSALAELRALSLAASELRTPLTGMLSTVGRILPADADPTQTAHFNRRIYQLLRIIGNMSDAVYYVESSDGRMEYVQLCAFLEELLTKSTAQLLAAGIHLEYSLPNAPIYTLADTEKIERAVYNMVSNAAKHTSVGGTIRVDLVRKKRLYLSVTDSGVGTKRAPTDLYHRYLRTPSVSDGSEGIGLGMVLVRATAALHGGTVLIDHPNAEGTRVTMTMDIRQGKSAQVRSPILYPDYAGERDHCLQELSDVLPAELYAGENLF